MRWLAPVAAALLSAGAGQAMQSSPPDNGFQVDSDAAASACLTPAQARQSPDSMTLVQRRRIVACIDAAAARQLNAQLPRQIDEVTRLDRITTEGPLLIYHYSVSRRLADLPSGVIPAIERATRVKVCSELNMVRTMTLGGSYGYRWVDPDGREIHRITITRC